MRDGHWRLTYPGTNLEWSGTRATPIGNVTVDLGEHEVRTADVDQPHSDGTLMGVDYRGGRTITFEMDIKDTPEGVQDHLADLAAAWDGDTIRREPGAVAELRCAHRGQERVVYGRPRRLATDTSGVVFGHAGAIADFRAVDHHFYSAEVQQVVSGIVASIGGGVASPLTTPLATTGQTDRSVVMDVDSPLPVWPVVTITGPVTDPEVEILGVWSMQVRTALAYDETLTIDTRPWRRRVTITPGGRNARGALTRDSVRLTAASVPAGRHEVAFRGRAESGSPSMSIQWQTVHSAP